MFLAVYMYLYVYNCEGLSFDLYFGLKWFKTVCGFWVFRGFELNSGMTNMPGLGDFKVWLF